MVEAGRVTAIIDGDISQLTSKLAQARSQATTAVSGIESDVKGKIGTGLAGAISGGNWKSVGQGIGADLVGSISAPFGALGGVATTVATTLGPVGVAAGLVGAAVIGVGSASVGVAASFQQSMANVASVTGGGIEAQNQLAAAAREAGASTVFSASQAGDAMYFLASSGMNTTQIVSALNPVLTMAAAGGMDLARASELTTTGLAVFGQTAERAGTYTNVLAATAAASNTDISQMGEAMGRVGGTAHTLGMSVEQTAASLGVLANGGIKGAEAGTKLNAILGQLTVASSAPTERQAAAMEELGVSADDLNPTLHTQAEIFGLLAEKGMTGAQSLALFGLENNSAASYLAANSSQLTTLEGKITGTSKATEMAAQQNATYQGSMKMLGSAVEGAQIAIGGALLPALTGVVGGITSVVNAATAIGGNLWEPLTTGISPVTEGITAVIGAVGTLGGMTLDGLVASSKGVNTAFQVGKAFVSAFKEEITEIITSSSTFQTISGYVDTVSDAFGRLGDWAGDTFEMIVSGLANAIPAAVSGALGALRTLADKAGLGGVADAVSSIGGFLGDVYDKAAEKLGWSIEEATEEGTEKGMEKGTKAAKSDISDAFASASMEGMSKGLSSVMQGFGVSDIDALNIINGQTSSSKGYAGSFGRGSGSTVTDIQGLKIRLAYHANKFDTDASLIIDGQTVAQTHGSDKRSMIADLLQQAKILGANEGNILDLSGETAQASLWRINETIGIDSYLSFADNLKDEMSAAGEEINAAFLDGLTPDKANIEGRLNSIKLLKLYDPEEAKRQGADDAISFLSGLQGALDDFEEAKTTYILEPDNELAAKALQIARDRLQAGLDKNPLVAKVEADTSLFNTKMDNLAGSIDLKKLLSDPAEFKTAVMDIPEFMENTFQPALNEQIDFFKTQWHSGIAGAQQETEDFLGAMIDAAAKMPYLFSEDQIAALYRYQAGLLDVGSTIDTLSGDIDSLADRTKSASVGWDELKRSMEGCGDTAEDVCDGLGCALSDFAKWQEAQTDLFQGSYIGPGGQDYLAWKLPWMEQVADTQNAMKLVGGAVTGTDYTEKVQEIKAKLSVDTTAADTTIEELESSIAEERKMPLKIDDAAAKATIAGIDAAASKPVTKYVYVVEVGGGGGGGNSTFSPSGSISGFDYDASWRSTMGTLSFANEGYVAAPTLAVVGDRPGGEYVVGAARFEAAASKINNNGGITINYSPIINGSNLSAEELSTLLEKHDEKLFEKIAEAKLWG